MKKLQSLTEIIRLYMWLISSVLVLIIGSLWVMAELNHSTLKQQEIREVALARQQDTLKAEIDSVIVQIEDRKKYLDMQLRSEIKKRTEEAYQTALYIYEQNKGVKNNAEITKLIHDALYAVSWDSGRGYYFAEDMQGTELINRNNPELEGTDISSIKDSNGKYIMDAILTVVSSKEQEGFCSYFWNRPNAVDVLVEKVSYVKYFAPLDWVIGNGAYLDDADKKFKQLVLRRIGTLKLSAEKYIFAGDFTGKSLVGPAKGKNMWGATDPNGTKIVQELIRQARNGGGFVEYVLPKFTGQRPVPKLSYAAQISGWDWYVGTGVYVDYIEAAIAQEQDNSRDKISKIITKTVVVLGLFLIVSFIISWKLAGKIKLNIALFLDFFQKSARNKLSIPADKVSFDEFQSLAISANQMVADRQVAWDELQAEQERLAVTLESIGDGVMTTDTAGNVVLLNRVAEQLTGWSRSAAVGKSSTEVFNIINEDSGEKCAGPIHKVLSTGTIVELANHTVLIAKDGRHVSIADSGAPILDSSGAIIGVILVFRDVTTEKKIEADLLKIKKLESVGILAGGIAHDFNNLLAGILGNIELVRRHIDNPDKIVPLLEGAQKASNRAVKLTQRLLTFARGGAPVKEAASIEQIIIDSAGFVLSGSAISCGYSGLTDIWQVNVDAGQIGQVIQNIVLNAKQSMSSGGQIVITGNNLENCDGEGLPATFSGRHVKITITDTGVGIPPKVLEQIFDPYYTTKQEGSGLGLAICHSIITGHNGHIGVKSIVGEGTTFTLYLPITVAIELGNVATTKQEIKSGAIDKLRIMVMDDEEVIRDVMKNQLVYFGHEVVVAVDGAEAISYYRKMQSAGNPLDLIIMDLTIPGGMGGKIAVKEILKLNPVAKVIVASGYSNDPVVANFRDYGFVAALSKPIKMDVLNKIIASLF